MVQKVQSILVFKLMLQYTFTVPVMGYDQCWFFRDSFGCSSFEQYFQAHPSTEYNGYLKANFDTRGIFGNFMSENRSIVGRIANLMANAVSVPVNKNNKIYPLSKIIVVVPDADFVQDFKNLHSVSKPFARILNYIMTEHECCVSSMPRH